MSLPLQLTLPPDLSDAIAEEAARHGMQPQTLILDVLRKQFPAQPAPSSPAPADASASPRTLADRLAKYIGAVSSGDGKLSEQTGRRFTEILVQQHNETQQRKEAQHHEQP